MAEERRSTQSGGGNFRLEMVGRKSDVPSCNNNKFLPSYWSNLATVTRHVTRTREECQYLAKKLEEFGNVEFLAPSGWSRGGERHAASLHPFRFVSLSLSRPSFFYNHLVIILDTPDARTRILDRARTIIPFFISLEKSGRKFYEIVAIKNFLKTLLKTTRSNFSRIFLNPPRIPFRDIPNEREFLLSNDIVTTPLIYEAHGTGREESSVERWEGKKSRRES